MASNIPELSVSDLSRALKRTVEEAYERVRVRGEVSGFKRAASGHLYMTLKDQDAVLDAVCWRGSAGRLMVTPEDGLEVIATGRLTTFAGRSKYQIVIDQVELAGEGALLKLLEERRRKLAAEGLFDEGRKRPIPFLPSVIGVVTSPTGAVIRDILHRLSDRFPRHVIVWPTLVQGDGAAETIARAIHGFNALDPGSAVPRPDLLIVARGGGSLEDLWAFNEEVVVRAAAESAIPLISAVGHETDTTLIDFASDRRAPTPTAAAEMAVPVRAELRADLSGLEQRLIQIQNRGIENRTRHLEGFVRGLPNPQRLFEAADQRLDIASDRLSGALPRSLKEQWARLEGLGRMLRSPHERLLQEEKALKDRSGRIERAVGVGLKRNRRRIDDLDASVRMDAAIARLVRDTETRIDRAWNSIRALSYVGTLERGFAVIRGSDGRVVTDGAGLSGGMALEIEFRDESRVSVEVAGEDDGKPPMKTKKAKSKKTPAQQTELF